MNTSPKEIAVVMVSMDRHILKEDSTVSGRMKEYARCFGELHIILFATKGQEEKIARDGYTIYPTNSLTKFHHITSARAVGEKLLPSIQSRFLNVVVSVSDPFETGWVGKYLKRRFKVALQVQVHTDFLSGYFMRGSVYNPVRILAARRVLQCADGVRVVSERIRRSLIESNIHISAPIDVLPIFVEEKEFLSPRQETGENTVVTLSRLEKEKNIESAIRIFKKVHDANINTRLIVIGDGSERKSLEQLAEFEGLTDSVTFAGWLKTPEKILQKATVFLHTSYYEGYGIALIEAALAGVPMVTTNVGVAEELVDNGSNSFVIDVHNLDEFAEKITFLLQDPRLRTMMSERIRIRAKELTKITKSEYMAEYAELHRKALEHFLSTNS